MKAILLKKTEFIRIECSSRDFKPRFDLPKYLFSLLAYNLLILQLNIIELVILSKLEKSKSEVRRLIKGSAIKINNQVIENDKFIIEQDLFNDNYLKLSIGKKRHIKIKLI